LSVEIKMGDRPAVGDYVFSDVEGLDAFIGYKVHPVSPPETSASGEATIRIQINQPGTHQVTVHCAPFSLDHSDEVSETVTLTVTRFAEHWTGSLGITSPMPDVGGPVAYGTIDIDFSFTYTSPWDQGKIDETVSVSSNITITSTDDFWTIVEQRTPANPVTDLHLYISCTSNEYSFFDPNNCTFQLNPKAEDVFYWYRYVTEADGEGEWSLTEILVRTAGEPMINEFDLQPGTIQDKLLNCINEGDDFVLTLSK